MPLHGPSQPVPIDNVRRITNGFRGRLGIAIAEELWLRGADVIHIQGDGALKPQPFIPCRVAGTYDYRAVVANRGEETGAEGEQVAWLAGRR
jgi:phosphopantothenoylcysteine decarboxylase/phosphopantothenate--cysteine ligase